MGPGRTQRSQRVLSSFHVLTFIKLGTPDLLAWPRSILARICTGTIQVESDPSERSRQFTPDSLDVVINQTAGPCTVYQCSLVFDYYARTNRWQLLF